MISIIMSSLELLLAIVFVLCSVVDGSGYYHPPAQPSVCHKHTCHKLAYCIPHQYSYKCVCAPGFFGNGHFCTRFPACTNNPCPAGSTCLPGLLGGRRCVCSFLHYRAGSACISYYSCQNRCGRPYNPLFPCQCDANCAQFGICCKDFSSQCPNIIPLLKKPVFIQSLTHSKHYPVQHQTEYGHINHHKQPPYSIPVKQTYVPPTKKPPRHHQVGYTETNPGDGYGPSSFSELQKEKTGYLVAQTGGGETSLQHFTEFTQAGFGQEAGIGQSQLGVLG